MNPTNTVGEESGPSARPSPLEWTLDLRAQARQTGCAFFLKQAGANPHAKGKPIKFCDYLGGDWKFGAGLITSSRDGKLLRPSWEIRDGKPPFDQYHEESEKLQWLSTVRKLWRILFRR